MTVRAARRPARALAAALLWALVPTLLLVLLAAVGALIVEAELGDLVREATTVGDLPFYAGGLSAFNVAFWSAAAAVALAATVGRPWRDRQLGEHVLLLGLLSSVLALDDQFRLHDDGLIRLGLPEKLVFVGYAAIGALAVYRARDRLRARDDTVVLGLALLLLALSVGVDAVQAPLQEAGLDGDARVYLEDSFKLVGAAVWLRWIVLVSRDVHCLSDTGPQSS